VRCTYCASKKKKCTNVVRSQGSPKKAKGQGKKKAETVEMDEDDEGEEEDVVEVVEESPKSSKGKGILSSLAKGFKRKLADRSPEAAVASESSSRFQMVCVSIPAPPLPHSAYIQLGARASTSSVVSYPTGEMGPPLSSSPSLASFDSHGSGPGRHYEVEHLKLLLSASQEDLRIQQENFDEERKMLQRRLEERDTRYRERAEKERAVYEARIRELENAQQSRGSGSSHRG
jgi:hypothetical protein